jgi:selenide,water dikinase
VLSEVLQILPPSRDPNLLVGFDTSDDATVYRVSSDIAIISTADFITPPVDDPYWFGQIAAANALSDVYAMGGKPLTALNLVMFPSKKLDIAFLKEILHGGNDKVVEAGASIGGGHSVDDEEPKYGLAVTGIVHPDRILTNRGAKSGDALVLTKPLGTGVLFNACRAKKLAWAELEPLLSQVAFLNKKALEIALHFTVHACTDITGFGFVGHSFEMAKGSGVQLDVLYEALPFYPNALRMYQKGQTTGSNKTHRELARGAYEKAKKLSEAQEELLFDPQTSGGLLFSVPTTEADPLVSRLRKEGIAAASRVGEVVANVRPCVRIV